MTEENTVNDELMRIYERDGKLQPSVIVKEAKAKDSPLHGQFEWHNGKAAQKYRLIQARKIIRKAKIVYEDGETTKFVHVPKVDVAEDMLADSDKTREGYYKDARIVAKNMDEFNRAMSEAVCKLRSAQHAVRILEEAANEKGKDSDVVKIAAALKSLEMAAGLLESVH